MPETLSVISNTSPLFYLGRIGQIAILQRLYGQIVVPSAVQDELRAGGPDAPDIRHYAWIESHPVQIPVALRSITDLGNGEAGVIALALQNKSSSLVIIDDNLGRHVASSCGLRITGTAGVLLKAKQQGLIQMVKPLVDQLLRNGFYLRPRHVAEICRLAGE